MRKVLSPLSDVQKTALRTEARSVYDVANPGLRERLGLQIHHRVPLEWAHLFSDADPNRLANLIGLRANIHEQINAQWNTFRLGLGGRVPSAEEVLQYTQEIEKQYSQYYH